MTTRGKEIAKFFCGFETYHALASAYFWLSGTSLTVFGFEITPGWGFAGTLIHAIIAIGLGAFAWRSPVRV